MGFVLWLLPKRSLEKIGYVKTVWAEKSERFFSSGQELIMLYLQRLSKYFLFRARSISVK